MWHENKTWFHYNKSILASDAHSAEFLASYLHYSRINKDYVSAIEIVDLQKYKIIREADKVRIALRERLKLPFVFIANKN